MHVIANSLSLLTSASAAPFLPHRYRRLLYSASSKRSFFSILNWTPKVFTNITKVNNPNYPMNIVSASTTPSPAKPAPFSADGPDKPMAKPPPPPQPWLIVGLGNPGKRYNATRHNVGFEMVDKIAQAEGISMTSVSFKALFGKGLIGNVPVMLAKPQTFMNASGWSNSLLL